MSIITRRYQLRWGQRSKDELDFEHDALRGTEMLGRAINDYLARRGHRVPE